MSGTEEDATLSARLDEALRAIEARLRRRRPKLRRRSLGHHSGGLRVHLPAAAQEATV
ncbi:unnamed protein product [Ectocarpus sp. CCAP 1310/34]|nr:unnamed protein product [Ectocarpus sp. CCAP 1310/34]